MTTKAAVILAAAVLLAALLHGGLYGMVGTGDYGVYRWNRWTGTVTWCAAKTCRPAVGPLGESP